MKNNRIMVLAILGVLLSSNLAFGVGEKTWKEWLSYMIYGKQGGFYGLEQKVADIKKAVGIDYDLSDYKMDQLESFKQKLEKAKLTASALGKRACDQIIGEITKLQGEREIAIEQKVIQKLPLVDLNLDQYLPEDLFKNLMYADAEYSKYNRKNNDFPLEEWSQIRQKFHNKIIEKIGGEDEILKLKLPKCRKLSLGFIEKQTPEYFQRGTENLKKMIYVIASSSAYSNNEHLGINTNLYAPGMSTLTSTLIRTIQGLFEGNTLACIEDIKQIKEGLSPQEMNVLDAIVKFQFLPTR